MKALRPNDKQIRQLVVVACFFGIAFEYNAIQLYLWPVRHACASSKNLVNHDYAIDFTDVHNQTIDPVGVQKNLLDATPEDPFTQARASSLDIKFDDISNCYEYPTTLDNTTGDIIVNSVSLEECKHGLQFDEYPGSKISIIEHFRLACSRQWLQQLIYLSLPLGLLFGLYVRQYNESVNLRSMDRLQGYIDFIGKTNAVFWIMLVLVTVDLNVDAHSHKASVEERNGKLAELFFCIFIRATLYVILWLSASHSLELLNLSRVSQGHDLRHREILMFMSVLVLAKALFMPFALRSFVTWSKMNFWFTLGVVIIGFLNMVAELGPKALGKYKTPQQQDSGISMTSNQNNSLPVRLEQRKPSQDIASLLEQQNRDASSNDQPEIGFIDPTSASSGHIESSNASHPVVKVCEYCLIRDVGSLRIDSSSPYSPTTVSTGFANEYNLMRQHEIAFPGDDDARLSGSTLKHNSNTMSINLLQGSNVKLQIMILTFCLTFNYFLIQMMPDHKLLHSETIKSLSERKEQIHSTFGHFDTNHTMTYKLLPKDLRGKETTTIRPKLSTSIRPESRTNTTSNPTTHTPVALLNTTPIAKSPAKTNASRTNPPIDGNLKKEPKMDLIQVATININTSTNASPDLEKSPAYNLFSYVDHNYATNRIDAARDSANPIIILFNTALINGWLIEFCILALYLSNLTNFRTSYFRLHRIFTIAFYGSIAIFAEWVLIVITSQRKNHLFETNWLTSLLVVTTRILSSAMLFQHISSLARLSHKLDTNQLLPAKTILPTILVALSLAIFAPSYERFSLSLIPIGYIISASIVYATSNNLSMSFKDYLCPMLFKEEC